MQFLQWCAIHKIELIIAAVVVALLIVTIGLIIGVHKRKKRNFEPYFRKFHDKRTQGHPQYIYDENGNRYKVIGVTHAPKTNGVVNIRLEVNPEPGNETPAYIRPTTDEIDKKTRSKRLNGWKLSLKDNKKVKKIIRNSKKTKK